MSKNIVFEGWLTKSPPSKRIWRTKWRRRWFALRQSGELPGQYFLDYYADRNCRRLKGTINLDLCEQVDAGLHMERTGGNGALNPKLRGSVFTIQTQSRTYHLEADCETDMERWVDAICRVCGLRATEDTSEEIVTHPPITSAPAAQYELADSTGPYIPISECITGVRAQDSQRAFTFDAKNIVTSARTPLERVADNRDNQMYISQPQIRLHNADLSENESNLSEEECRSLNASQSNIRDYSVAKSFTKLSINREKNGGYEDGPPVPPRPPKTFALSKEMFTKEIPPTPKIQEPVVDPQDPQTSGNRLQSPRRMSHGAAPPTSPVRPNHSVGGSWRDDDEDIHIPQSLHYYNLANLPPAVDRALKPRPAPNPASPNYSTQGDSASTFTRFLPREEMKSDVLQYLDLDLLPISDSAKPNDTKRVEIVHGKSFSAADADSAYKTVDFLKTEAFNITRQDAEASRNNY
ncbi:GRB2-associated-binding protein 2 isoform X2 [Ostrinia furnacalis]|uniref:GRB2-associated-binding protein 2 isoform X2 n=1 Tax=Ostrinia furnacalis TaxID=93504 RepID=UPI001038D708|nr:GRB2-associated-binding protein 2 isoform X2 [Ostrinia furnacalis]